MSQLFSTKAGTLYSLRKVIKNAKIPEFVFFSVSEWREDQEKCVRKIKDSLGEGPLIVRSSCFAEDQLGTSGAGEFLSVPNLSLREIVSSVEEVIESYGEKIDKSQILIQRMLTDVIRSGVGFSHDPNTCTPYRVINWSEGNDTSLVTSGANSNMWQQAARCPKKVSSIHSPIITLIEELLELYRNQPLDIEFAVTSNEQNENVWLLQVRPLFLHQKPETESKQQKRLQKIQQKLEIGMTSHPFLMGKRTVYGVMPDWNPAEIVGIRPKPLALSLYRELVTDSIWAYQRHNYGYRNLRSFPLMPHFFGLPYIDVRLSFNSFIPVSLNEDLAARLVDYYIDRLLKEPSLHDKVEFDIVFSCYTLDLQERLNDLKNFGFSRSELILIADSLRELTKKIVDPENGLWRGDADRLTTLDKRYNIVNSSKMDEVEKIYWFLEDTKRYGTLPFAGLARAGFIAVQFLHSLVAKNVFSQEDYYAFMSGLTNINSQMAYDRMYLEKPDFLSRYGHLRPGTYDITSPRYDEAPELYFDWDLKPANIKKPNPFLPSAKQMQEIAKLIKYHRLQIDPQGLIEFITKGIELRELAKFNFTRNLSDAISCIQKFGQAYGFSTEDLAYCDIQIFKEIHVSATNIKNLLSRNIYEGRKNYADTLKIVLPPLIVKPEDVWAFDWPQTAPNYITQKQVIAFVSSSTSHDDLPGSIVCIENADPGFDWLFSFPISGLITAWGGANSHMAIRAGELGLPAVIGAGEALYNLWSSSEKLHIDCASRKVEVLA